MKRIFSVFIVFVLVVFMFSGCSKETDSQEVTSDNNRIVENITEKEEVIEVEKEKLVTDYPKIDDDFYLIDETESKYVLSTADGGHVKEVWKERTIEDWLKSKPIHEDNSSLVGSTSIYSLAIDEDIIMYIGDIKQSVYKVKNFFKERNFDENLSLEEYLAIFNEVGINEFSNVLEVNKDNISGYEIDSWGRIKLKFKDNTKINNLNDPQYWKDIYNNNYDNLAFVIKSLHINKDDNFEEVSFSSFRLHYVKDNTLVEFEIYTECMVVSIFEAKTIYLEKLNEEALGIESIKNEESN